MKRNNLFKILIIITIACLLFLAFFPHPYPLDGFILPALFALTVILIILATLSYPSRIEIQSRSVAVYQLRAPPVLLF